MAAGTARLHRFLLPIVKPSKCRIATKKWIAGSGYRCCILDWRRLSARRARMVAVLKISSQRAILLAKSDSWGNGVSADFLAPPNTQEAPAAIETGPGATCIKTTIICCTFHVGLRSGQLLI